jgi:hypothetical protein
MPQAFGLARQPFSGHCMQSACRNHMQVLSFEVLRSDYPKIFEKWFLVPLIGIIVLTEVQDRDFTMATSAPELLGAALILVRTRSKISVKWSL